MRGVFGGGGGGGGGVGGLYGYDVLKKKGG